MRRGFIRIERGCQAAGLPEEFQGHFIVNAIEKRIWALALPHLRKGVRKDFVLHTKAVSRALKLLLRREKGDEDILIPAAILHDVGWSTVPVYLQKAKDEKRVKEAMHRHLEDSVPIIKDILAAVSFDKKRTNKVIEIVLAHKFRSPRNIDKRLLIDADTLSDVFKEPFYTDAKQYNVDPDDFYQIRKKNTFYTQTARDIFRRELKKRAREIGIQE